MKRNIKLDIPIKIWQKIFDAVIEPIALYGCEVWGPLTNQDFIKWDKHQIETLHAEFCKSILKVQRKTPNNACRAELGRYPIVIKISITTLRKATATHSTTRLLPTESYTQKSVPLASLSWDSVQHTTTNTSGKTKL